MEALLWALVAVWLVLEAREDARIMPGLRALAEDARMVREDARRR